MSSALQKMLKTAAQTQFSREKIILLTLSHVWCCITHDDFHTDAFEASLSYEDINKFETDTLGLSAVVDYGGIAALTH